MEHHAADQIAISVDHPDGLALSEAMRPNLGDPVSDELGDIRVMPIEQAH